MNEPRSHIPEDRRSGDIVSLKERMAVVETRTEALERQTTGIHYALFGLPEDRNNNGLVGTVAEVKSSMANANRLLLATLLSSLAALIIGSIK